ncbi:MAG TPA: hypothetical protein VNM92_15915 [Thermoanaerobaculia bacterium]|nr:hypothetical protein [Thermoanaerobaculia bacterium]
MRTVAIVVALSFAALDGAPGWIQRMLRETNSSAATARGMREFQRSKFVDAARSFRRSGELFNRPSAAFNLGTAEIAAGSFAEGAASIAPAMKNLKLRPDALYNRGTGALRANANDNAIRDLTDALRLRPGDLRAKRNLEIALKKKAESEKEPNQKQQTQGDQDEKPEGKDGQEQEGESSADALLRAVQQQEREELSRMRRSRPSPERIGW